jgi:hypothetical protein
VPAPPTPPCLELAIVNRLSLLTSNYGFALPPRDKPTLNSEPTHRVGNNVIAIAQTVFG